MHRYWYFSFLLAAANVLFAIPDDSPRWLDLTGMFVGGMIFAIGVDQLITNLHIKAIKAERARRNVGR